MTRKIDIGCGVLQYTCKVFQEKKENDLKVTSYLQKVWEDFSVVELFILWGMMNCEEIYQVYEKKLCSEEKTVKLSLSKISTKFDEDIQLSWYYLSHIAFIVGQAGRTKWEGVSFSPQVDRPGRTG